MVEVEVDQRRKGRSEVGKHSVAENIIASLSRHRGRGRLRWRAGGGRGSGNAGGRTVGRSVARLLCR